MILGTGALPKRSAAGCIGGGNAGEYGECARNIGRGECVLLHSDQMRAFAVSANSTSGGTPQIVVTLVIRIGRTRSIEPRTSACAMSRS